MTFSTLLLVATLAASANASNPAQSQEQYRAQAKIDSLTRALEGKLFSASEQKSWQACVRHKRETLAAERKADKSFAEVDTLLRRAKLSQAGQEDTAVQKLLERKFLLEKGLEDRYNASPEGHRCLDLEKSRQHQLDSALTANPDFQKWKRKLESSDSNPGSI